MAYIGKTPIVGNFQKCDALTASATADYTLQVGSSNVSPESVNHMIVSLNGIIQQPGATGGFTVSGSTLSFTSALTSSDTIDFVILLGNVLDIGTPSDDTVGAAQIKDDLISGTTALAVAPADTDEFLVSDAGTLKRIDYSLIKGGGKIGQVISTLNLTLSTLSTSSFADISGQTVNITPSASSSKILIFNHISCGAGVGRYIMFKLLRDSTSIGAGSDDSNRIGCVTSINTRDSSALHTVAFQVLDSPSTTSQITYKVQARSNSANAVDFNRTNTDDDYAYIARASSGITVMEVLA